ncbi:LysR family transcriptional regulator [Mesorhizobium sp. NPDC059054]|uniref:LysR family transcriptional regulator n=1 Tax=Mesorhizobium sp. NPDC059054 TaxID=3346711 RepID=UPI0036B04E11
MLDLDDLIVFAEVSDAGGLTRAGRRLGMSKSILSRRLSRLEQALGVTLLVRTPRGVHLTEEGANFKPFADRMIGEISAARDALSRKEEPSGTLRVAAPLSFGQSHIAPLLTELGQRYPQLRIHAFYSDRLIDLVGERFDAGIRIGAMPDSTLLATRIAPVRSGVVASPDYVARCGAPQTLDDIGQHYTLVHADHPWRFQVGPEIVTFRPKSHFMADNSHALLTAAKAGLGIAMLPSFLIGPGLLSGDLLPLLEEYPCPVTGLFLVRPPATGAMTTKVKVLFDLLRERFGESLEWDVCQRYMKSVDGEFHLPAIEGAGSPSSGQ